LRPMRWARFGWTTGERIARPARLLLLGGDPVRDAGEAEQPLCLGGDASEHKAVAVRICAPLRADQKVHAGAVDKPEIGEVEHDGLRAGMLGFLELPLERGAGGEVDLAAEEHDDAVSLKTASELRLTCQRTRWDGGHHGGCRAREMRRGETAVAAVWAVAAFSRP
jgi:hypothetical protein